MKKGDFAMNDKNIRTFVGAAMMTALCAVLTSVVKIPSPMGGYFNLGDCGVLLSAWLLGPAWGAAAAGLGSALSDLLGYPLYAPATLVIKALMAAAAGGLFQLWGTAGRRPSLATRVVSGCAAEGIMIAGYFAFEAVLLGMGMGAAANLPFNVAQGVAGVVSAAAVMGVLTRVPGLSQARH